MGSKIVFLVVLLLTFAGQAQKRGQYKIRTIAFYNVENLFDIVNDSLIFDDDRTPNGKDRWTLERYKKKITQTSKVISEIGKDITRTSPDILGLCEVENRQVVEDLANHPHLRDKDYGIVHFDSPDERGIDVALLYKRAAFLPISFKSYRLLLFNDEDKRDYTRDQLVVGGLLDDEKIYLIVNHWPSRSGGEARSRPKRLAAAKLNKKIIDSILKIDPSSKIISMGDLNDNPTDDSLKKILKTTGEQKDLENHALFNPMEGLFKKGAGSLAYRDKWSLFDQFFFTSNLAKSTRTSYSYWKAGIYNPPYLITQNGKYKGYPYRTYAGGNYTGGYSDHFPVYLYFIREVE